MSDESHPWFYLLDRNGEKCIEELYIENQNGEIETVNFKLVILIYFFNFIRKKIKCSQKNQPGIDHFYISVLLPPETPTQTTLTQTVRAVPPGYLTTDQRAYMLTVRPNETKSVILVEWEMLMRPASLKPKYEGIEYPIIY